MTTLYLPSNGFRLEEEAPESPGRQGMGGRNLGTVCSQRSPMQPGGCQGRILRRIGHIKAQRQGIPSAHPVPAGPYLDLPLTLHLADLYLLLWLQLLPYPLALPSPHWPTP